MAATQSGSENTDLLKQPSPPNDGFQDDDNQDQIGSNTPSPSGIATPQPDPADRRLPSIMHNYFQVGSSSAVMLRSLKTRFSLSDPSPSSADNAQPSAPPDTNGTYDDPTSGHSSSSSSSFVMVKRDEARSCSPDTPPPDKEMDPQDISHENLQPAALPTPPCSSACSFLQKETEESEADKGVGSIFTTLKNYLSPSRSVSCSDPKARRHTSHPVSSVSDNPVLASHFSNPSHSLSHASEALCLAEAPPLDHEKPPVSASSENQSKLTDDSSNSSQLKNTPPLTPRALSNDDLQAATMKKPAPPPPSSNPKQSPPGDLSDSADEITEKLNEVLPSAMETSSPDDVAPVAPQKGKLHVKISKARGLQPGFDPYVVCVFEWNEVISKSVKDEEEETLKRQKKEFEQSSLDGGRPMAIPMNRQSSHNSALDNPEHRGQAPVTDPQWNHEAVFDVFGESSEVDVSVYDRKDSEAFLGHVRLCVNLKDDHSRLEGWFPLNGGAHGNAQVSGEIHLEMLFEKEDKKQVGPNDFQILKLIGKGTFGQVYQVRKKDTRRIYAMKVLSKKVIIQKKEVAHTVGERNILVRTAMAASPFIVGLKFSFQTPTDLYLVTDYMSGGELFWHLQKEGRFQEPRAKFYIAELILALQHLHDHDIVYRDLKPENILLDANGHIALCDFGLSKANLTQNDTTNTFCGTTEYLAPEVLLDEQGYTKMVDFWSLGVLVFEMCCGWSPFYADDTQQMYKNIAFGKVRFPRDALSTEGRNFVKGLLNRNPKHRLGAQGDAKELMEHPFFHDVDWKALGRKEIIPPFKPKLDSVTDTSNFDPEFTNALDNSNSLNLRAAALANGFMAASTPLSPGMQANFKGFTFVNESSIDHHLKPEGGDRMDEDESWTRSHRSGKSIDQHMTGVQRNGDAGEIFNVDDNFDM